MTAEPPRDPRYQPISGMDLPRFAGAPSFMRLPPARFGDAILEDAELAMIGVPYDGGTTNRPGARHGPRQLRDASTMIRRRHPATGFDPFAAVNAVDLGDVAPNPVDLPDSLDRITAFFAAARGQGLRTLAAGGDHLITLPILRALSAGQRLGLIQFDSHTDLFDSYFGGFRYTHGTPFRRAIEEDLLDPTKIVQIGIRGTMYDDEDLRFARSIGVRIIDIDEFFAIGPERAMAIARDVVGDHPTYASLDIDFVDPAYAPGTGTPEVGGPTSHQAQVCVRGLAGVNLVGADLVEVSPPFDPSGGTAWLGASLMFELFCVLAEATARGRGPAVASV